MAIETVPYDPAAFLDTPEAQAAYLEVVFKDGDPSDIAAAIGTIVRARGATDVAKAADLSRESIYKAFARDGNPTLSTLMRVLKVLGIALRPEKTA